MQTFDAWWDKCGVNSPYVEKGTAREAWHAGQAALRGRMEALLNKWEAELPHIRTEELRAALAAPLETGKPAGKAEPR